MTVMSRPRLHLGADSGVGSARDAGSTCRVGRHEGVAKQHQTRAARPRFSPRGCLPSLTLLVCLRLLYTTDKGLHRLLEPRGYRVDTYGLPFRRCLARQNGRLLLRLVNAMSDGSIDAGGWCLGPVDSKDAVAISETLRV